MGTLWEQLAEARIQDWRRRVAEGEVEADGPGVPSGAESFELQLFKEIMGLLDEARELEDGAPRREALRRANDLRIQLMACVEKDRPLLAQTLAGRLARAWPSHKGSPR